MITIVILIIAGFMSATIGGMVGLGGGFILVPFLSYFWPEAAPATVTFTSLVMIVFNSVSGTVSYSRQKRIDFRSGVVFAVATVIPAVIGVYVVRRVPMSSFAPIFGGLLIMGGALVVWRATRKPPAASPLEGNVPAGYTRRCFTDAFGVEHRYQFRMPYGIGSSIAAGFASSFFGIGGGLVHVPVLTQALKWPPHVATATSNFVLAVSATVGVVTHLASGGESSALGYALCAGFGAIFGAQLAAQLARRVAGRTLLLVLAGALFLVGARMLGKLFC